MIARQETGLDRADVWRRLAEPVDETAIAWRQDGKVVQRDGRYFARFVAYIEANTVRERLDAVVPGEWDLTLELLPALTTGDDPEAAACSFKARLQILGVIREDVGYGRDYKSASTDAFKRAAVRFGIAHELYAYEQNWVEMDGDGRYAKPLEDPAEAYARRMARRTSGASRVRRQGVRKVAADSERDDREPLLQSEVESDSVKASSTRGRGASARASTGITPLRADDTPPCPSCGGRMWDNRLTKRNPRAPDFKCRDRNCDGVVWPVRATESDDPDGNSAVRDAPGAGPLVEHQESVPF